jgi:hypothetical protein
LDDFPSDLIRLDFQGRAFVTKLNVFPDVNPQKPLNSSEAFVLCYMRELMGEQSPILQTIVPNKDPILQRQSSSIRRD